MTQKFLGHPLSVFYPQDCTKSPCETVILRTPIQGQKRILDSHGGIFDFSDSFPHWLDCAPYQGSAGKPCVQEPRRQRLISGRRSSYTGITPAAAKARSSQVLRNSPWAMPLAGYELVRPELTCKESALLRFH